MNKKYSIPAFSIVEVMVSMAITAIIIGLIFGIFSIVSEQILLFKEQNQYTADFNRLSYSISKAIFESEKMQLRENSLHFQTYDGKTLIYNQQDDFLIRKAEQFTDTFQLQFQQIQLDTVYNTSKSKIFQKLELQLEANKQPYTLRFYKPVYANDIINFSAP
ncbi:PulJ/GspJ family protein [Flavobacterium sp. U410]